MITKRQIEVLKYILENPERSMIDDLTHRFSLSERSIRYDIAAIRKQLQQYQVELKHNVKQGFYVPINQRVLVDKIVEKYEDQQQDNQVNYLEDLINTLFCHRYLSLSQAVALLQISDKSVRKLILKYNRQNDIKILNKKNKGYYLVGNEYQIRMAATEMIYQLVRNKVGTDSFYQQLPSIIKQRLPYQNYIAIEKRYRSNNAEYQVWLSNDTYKRVLSYLIIQEIRGNIKIEMTPSVDHQYPQKLKAYALGLLSKVGINDNQRWDYEVGTFIQFLQENQVYINEEHIEIPPIDLALEQVEKYLKKQEKVSQLLFKYGALKVDLKTHFQHYFTHPYDITKEESDVLDGIAHQYPQFYQLAKECHQVFNQVTQQLLPAFEINYIAIYLYKNTRTLHQKKKVMVVCSTGRGLSTLLVTRIKHVFPQIEVVSKLSYYQLERLQVDDDVDFVLSTIPIEGLSIPSLLISTVLTNDDIVKIQKLINEESQPLSQDWMGNIDENLAIETDLFQAHAQAISQIVLALVDSIGRISKDYPMSYDAIMGLTIHLLMALPRWFQRQEERDLELIEEYEKICLTHPGLAKTMNVFFKSVENTLLIEIPIFEKYAFYNYILRRKPE